MKSAFGVTLALLVGFAPCPAFAQDIQEVRGVIRAVDEATLTSSLGRKIIKLPVKESGRFKKGDILARFDCASARASLDAARAKHRVEQIAFENVSRLAKMRAAGRFEVSQTQARAGQMAAEAESLGLSLAECDIIAPFDGEVAELRVHENETPERAQPIMRILDLTSFELDVIVPSPWLRWLKPGAAMSVSVDETGAMVSAELVRLGAVVDPVSQTVKAVGRLIGATSGILPDMSGSVNFSVPNG
jgi:membrane fusion protein, multidrug efflux system